MIVRVKRVQFRLSFLDTACLRRIEGTLPECISIMWNVETPTGSGWKIQQADSDEGWIPRWETLLQKANAVSRKATGIHNWTDRAKYPGQKAADVEQVGYRWEERFKSP